MKPVAGPEAASEAKRAVIATALGIALGVVAALFSRREDEGRQGRWLGRSAT